MLATTQRVFATASITGPQEKFGAGLLLLFFLGSCSFTLTRIASFGSTFTPHPVSFSRFLPYSELLPGWYEDWVIFERERLRHLGMHALEAAARRLTAQGDYPAALDAALHAVRREPLRESAHRAVILVHLAENNVVEALRAYKRFRILLVEQVGVEPSAGLTELVFPGSGGTALDTARDAVRYGGVTREVDRARVRSSSNPTGGRGWARRSTGTS